MNRFTRTQHSLYYHALPYISCILLSTTLSATAAQQLPTTLTTPTVQPTALTLQPQRSRRARAYKTGAHESVQQMTNQLQELLLLNPAERTATDFARTQEQNELAATELQKLAQQLAQEGFEVNQKAIDNKVKEFNAQPGTTNALVRQCIAEATQLKKSLEQKEHEALQRDAMLASQTTKIQELEQQKSGLQAEYTKKIQLAEQQKKQLQADYDQKIHAMHTIMQEAQKQNVVLQEKLNETITAKLALAQQLATLTQTHAQAVAASQASELVPTSAAPAPIAFTPTTTPSPATPTEPAPVATEPPVSPTDETDSPAQSDDEKQTDDVETESDNDETDKKTESENVDTAPTTQNTPEAESTLPPTTEALSSIPEWHQNVAFHLEKIK